MRGKNAMTNTDRDRDRTSSLRRIAIALEAIGVAVEAVAFPQTTIPSPGEPEIVHRYWICWAEGEIERQVHPYCDRTKASHLKCGFHLVTRE